MRLWRRASAIFKDQNSIWLANLTRRSALRNPDIEKAVIRATTHYDLIFDRRNIERVCEWIRISSFNLKPLLWSVSNRIEKTRNWVVALKGLYLMHNVINSRVPCVRKIGRLPFDLSDFNDGYSRQSKSWAFNTFIRAYYAFLDCKSTLVFQQMEGKGEGFVMKQELLLLHKLQALIDLLMQIKPQAKAAFVPIVLDVMDGIIIEIYDLYSRICRGIAIVLMNIYSADKAEAKMALNLVHKANQQGEDLSYYFEYCQEIGVVNASEFPIIDRILDEGLQELEQIIKSFTEDELKQNEEKAMVVVVREDGDGDDEKKKKKKNNERKCCYRDDLRTVITDKWEKFDEDLVQKDPPPLITFNQELPDLISFL